MDLKFRAENLQRTEPSIKYIFLTQWGVELLLICGVASQIWRQPGKRHLLGKFRHWLGFDLCTLQEFPSRNMQDPSDFWDKVKPARDWRNAVYFCINSSSLQPRSSDILLISLSLRMTSPGHWQHLPHLSHMNSIEEVCMRSSFLKLSKIGGCFLLIKQAIL